MTEKCDYCEEDLNPFDPGVYRLDSITESWSRKGDHSLMPRLRMPVTLPVPNPKFRHQRCMDKVNPR